MGVDAHYFSPTTPGAASFDVDVSAAIRRGRIGPLSKEAQLGAVGSGVVVLDDVDGTLGQLGDGILGLKQFYMNETECPAGNQRFFTGYTLDRSYYRANSLVQGAARTIDVTLMDPNAFLSFRVFAPEADDPTSSFVRGEEDSIVRIQALLAVDFLSTTLFDLGYIPTTGGKVMSAEDYTGRRPVDVINDIAQFMNWNAWVGYDETENKLFLWFDDWQTDGSETVVYDSALRLTNVESERDDVTTFLFEMNARETRNPGRLISAAYGTGTGVTSYRTMPTTAHIFGWRDAVIPSFYVKDQAKLDSLLDQELEENSTEEIRISLTVQLPADKVTAIKEGQRIQVHGTHMKSVSTDFTWCRIHHLSIRRDIATMEYYWLDLDVSPIIVPVEVCLTAVNDVVASSIRDAISGKIDSGLEDLRGTTWQAVATNPFHDQFAVTSERNMAGPINALYTWRLYVMAGPPSAPGTSIGDPGVLDTMVNFSFPVGTQAQGAAPPFTPMPTQTVIFTVPHVLEGSGLYPCFAFQVTPDYAPGAVTIDEGYEVCLTRIS